jgi:hypothetical protein
MKKTIIIKGQQQKALVATILGNLPEKPVHEVVIKVHKRKRSVAQNMRQRRWLSEAAEQLGDTTPEEQRGYCKLHFGVPILRNALPEECIKAALGFKETYDKHVRPLPYETKMACMMIPIDFPITRIMTTKQKAQYLEQIAIYFSGLGCKLTEPNRE